MAALPIVYNVTEAVLADLTTKQKSILVENPNIEDVKAAKREVAKLRTSIENHRLKLNEEAQNHIKNVNLKAKEAQAPIAIIEDKYAVVIDTHKAYLQKLADGAAAKEAARQLEINTRIQDINAYKFILHNSTIVQIQKDIFDLNSWLAQTSDFDYGERKQEAAAAIENVNAILELALSNRKIFEDEQEKAEIQRKIDDENRAKFEQEKAAFAEQQRAANEKLEAEILQLQKAKDDAAKAERKKEEFEADKLRAVEFAKQQEDRKKLIEEQNAMAEKIRLRQLEIKAENERIKFEQEKDTKIRNAAQQLYDACNTSRNYFRKIGITPDNADVYNELDGVIKKVEGGV